MVLYCIVCKGWTRGLSIKIVVNNPARHSTNKQQSLDTLHSAWYLIPSRNVKTVGVVVHFFNIILLQPAPKWKYSPCRFDCSDLVKDSVVTCPGGNNSVCLVHDFDINTAYSDIAQQCESSGGLALALYYQEPGMSDDIPIEFKLGRLPKSANIPVLRIAYNAGKGWKKTNSARLQM